MLIYPRLISRRPPHQLGARQQSPLQAQSLQLQFKQLKPPSPLHRSDGKTPAERRTLEETIAAIRLRTRHHDPYEEWERDTRRDALRTARHLRTSTNATRAIHLQSTHKSAVHTQQTAYTSQLADVQRLLDTLRINQREEEERMRQRWREEDRVRKERIEVVIRAEEEKVRVRLEVEQRRREEEERRRREEEEKRRREEEKKRKVEDAKRKAKEEEERQEREREETEKRRREKEEAEADSRRAIGMVSAGEDWRFARETLKNLKAGPMKTVKGDKALKSQWNAIRRQITPKIGQITQDQETISRITHQLIELVRPPTPHPQLLYIAALSSLSKSILLQAETEVTAEKKSAIPLALVTCALLHHPLLSDAFPEVFFAKLVQRTGGWGVPVVVPMVNLEGKPWAEGERRKAMGYRRTGGGEDGGNDEGEWEGTGEYATRVAGIMRVYFLVLGMSAAPAPGLATGTSQVGRAQKLFQLPHFWSYFARMLGDERLLETAVAAQVLYAALDVAGLDAGHIWGKQWIKLLELLYEASTVSVDSNAGTPGPNASGSTEGLQKRMRMLGGQTPEGKSARVRVQLEIERIVQAL
ncbi:GLE1-like protein-domain-containing protein [Scleroderma yunnanense]